jgi:NAD(P)H-dependent FMN reductase
MNILVLSASARPNNQGNLGADWVAREVAKRENIAVDRVDATTLELPFFDEASSPMGLKEYANPKGTEWAARVAKADAVIFVAGEYNHGYTALMKNTIDWVGPEWHEKPVAFVSYGADAGGARAVEQLRQVALQLNMLPVTDPAKTVIFPQVYFGAFEENGDAKDASKLDNLNVHIDKLVSLYERLHASA